MSIDQNLLGKGLKQLLVLLLLMILSPITLNIAFKSINKMDEKWIAYSILGIAILLTISTIVLAFKTFKTFLDALFNSK